MSCLGLAANLGWDERVSNFSEERNPFGCRSAGGRGNHWCHAPVCGLAFHVKISNMRKILTAIIVQIVATGVVLLSQASAQQSPAKSAQTGSTKTSTTQNSTAAKKPAGTSGASAAIVLKTQKAKNSYAIGMSMGMSVKRQSIDVDPALVARGVRDQLNASKTLMTEDEMRATLQQLQGELIKQQQAKAQAAEGVNRKEGDAFLAANKTKSGVTTLPSGLQYKVVTEGTGPKPTASDTVTVNYRGTLVNGKEFDSSYKRGQPTTFPVGGVIKGCTEALQLMPVGSKWQLSIPPDLAYGNHPPPGSDIGPGATLLFEVELLKIVEKK